MRADASPRKPACSRPKFRQWLNPCQQAQVNTIAIPFSGRVVPTSSPESISVCVRRRLAIADT